MRAIPSGVDDIIDISTLTFTMPVLINPPAKVTKQTIIHTIIDNINDTDEAGLAAIRSGNSYVPLFTSYKVVTLDSHKMRFTMDATGAGTGAGMGAGSGATAFVLISGTAFATMSSATTSV